jgi:membrane protein required for colicin V production
MPNSLVDIFVIAVILISAVLAFIRGLTREMLSLGTWLLAIYLAFTQFDKVAPYLEEQVANATIRDFLAGLIIFGAVLIILLPIGFYLRGFVKGEQVTAIDRSLGFVFGALRGYILMVVIYLVVVLALPEEKQPVWLKEANTKPALAYGAEIIRNAIPAEQRDFLEKKKKDAEEVEEQPLTPPGGSSLDGKMDQLDQVIQNPAK